MTAHILLDPDSDHGLLCSRCHGIDSVPYPCEVSRYIDVCRVFELRHRACPKPEKPSPQLALPGTEEQAQLCGECGTIHRPGDNTLCSGWRPFVQPSPMTTYPLSVLDSIDASTDEPAPEIDPPGPYQLFKEMYPLATNALSLTGDVRIALGSAHADVPLHAGISKWHPASGIFNAVANWARIEKAHLDAGKREPIAGLTLPRREPMPEKLAELLGVKPKEKRGARPLTSPKRRRAQGAEP